MIITKYLLIKSSLFYDILILISLIALVFFLLSNMSEKATDDLVNRIINNLDNMCFLTYISCIILIGAWYYHSKQLRRMHSKECQRIGKEKSKFQEHNIQLKNKNGGK